MHLVLNNKVSKWQSSLSFSFLSSFRNSFVYVNGILLYNNEENIALTQKYILHISLEN